MEVGINLVRGSVDELVRKSRLAEDLGFDRVGLADSQLLFRELYSSLGVMGTQTESIQVGSAISNPVTREPAVTAGGMCTVNEITDGRAWLGIATGDSAVLTLNKSPAELAELKRAIRVFKALCSGESVEYNETEIEMQWIDEQSDFDVPVYIAAEGPKTLQLAGEIADGVIIGTGLLPDSIQDSVDRIADGARKAGRNPADINKLVFTKSNIAETQERAVEEIKMALAASAHHAFRFTLEDKNVPDQYKEPIENLIEEYVPQHHEELGENPNKGLVDKYDLSEYLADRFAVTGTVDQCTQQYKRILDFDGVDGIFITALMEDDAEFISTVGSEIKPELV